MLAGMGDPDQKATYAAEDMLLGWIDGACPETGEVRVTLSRAGASRTVTYAPEVEPRFSNPDEVPPFVQRVLARLRAQSKEFGSRYRGRERRDVMVVAGRGHTKATYRSDIISLPERDAGGAWALRALVVLHELAHHLNTGVDGAIIDHHGEGFRATFVRLLEDIGWTETAAMLLIAYEEIGLDRRRGADDGMLAKVGKLLRHAEGASTEAERDAFFSKAQQLATTHSIELAQARAAHQQGEEQKPTFEPVRLGHLGGTSNVRFVSLMIAIAQANDLRCSIRGDNTGVTLYGFPSDIEVTKALYVALVVQMVAQADAYIRSGAHRPAHGRTARVSFYEGWTTRIGERLVRAQREAQTAAGVLTESVDGATGVVSRSKSLALVAKDVELDDYYGHMTRQHGIRGTWRGGAAVGDGRSVARGRAAAEHARLGNARALPG